MIIAVLIVSNVGLHLYMKAAYSHQLFMFIAEFLNHTYTNIQILLLQFCSENLAFKHIITSNLFLM